MEEKILEAARRVADIQAVYDAADHDTTTATFMEEHGPQWLERRNAVIGEIDVRRTRAIWELMRVVP